MRKEAKERTSPSSREDSRGGRPSGPRRALQLGAIAVGLGLALVWAQNSGTRHDAPSATRPVIRLQTRPGANPFASTTYDFARVHVLLKASDWVVVGRALTAEATEVSFQIEEVLFGPADSELLTLAGTKFPAVACRGPMAFERSQRCLLFLSRNERADGILLVYGDACRLPLPLDGAIDLEAARELIATQSVSSATLARLVAHRGDAAIAALQHHGDGFPRWAWPTSDLAPPPQPGLRSQTAASLRRDFEAADFSILEAVWTLHDTLPKAPTSHREMTRLFIEGKLAEPDLPDMEFVAWFSLYPFCTDRLQEVAPLVQKRLQMASKQSLRQPLLGTLAQFYPGPLLPWKVPTSEEVHRARQQALDWLSSL